MPLLSRSCRLLVFAAQIGLAYAQVPEGSSGVQDGQALIDRAKAIEKAASQQLERDKAECYQQVLVNNCLAPANARYREARGEAHKLEAEGANLKRLAKIQAKAEKKQKDLDEEAYREERQQTRMARERDQRERRDAARATDAEAKNARAEAFQRKHAEREARREAKTKRDAADLARREARAKSNPQIEREREYAERVAKVAERKKNYAEKLKREADEKASRQAALEAAPKSDQERGEPWSPRRWIKD